MAAREKIIDVHNHLWKFEDNEYFSWINSGMDILRRDFAIADLEQTLTKNQVMGSVLVQAIPVLSESEQLLVIADQHDFIKGVIGWCDITLGGQHVQKSIDRLQRSGKLLKGIRYMSQGIPPEHLLTKNFIEGCQTVGKNNLVYELLITEEQLLAAAELVKACPSVRFVVQHLAKPHIKNHEIAAWQKNMRELSKNSSDIYCKISGMVTEADWKQWKQEDFEPYMDAIYEIFGAEHLLFGSDWPVSLVAAKYENVKDIVMNWLMKHPEIDAELLFYKNAVRVYNIK